MGFSCYSDLSCLALCRLHRTSGQYLKRFQAAEAGSFSSFLSMEIFLPGATTNILSNSSLSELKVLCISVSDVHFFLSCLPVPSSLFRRNLVLSFEKRKNICSRYVNKKSQAVVNTTRPWLLTLFPEMK